MNEYEFLKSKFAEIGLLEQISGILSWDANVIMPRKASDARGAQLSYLNIKKHEIATSKKLWKQLEIANSKKDSLNEWDRANLILMNRHVNQLKALPSKLVAKITKATNKCEMAWREAKSQNNFKIVAKYLQEVIELVREAANLKGEFLGVDPYDALISDYDYGRTSKQIDGLFGDLKEFLIDLIRQIMNKQKPIKTKGRHFSADLQHDLCKRYLSKFKFDFDAGRLDTSSHPFCGGTPEDSRITTRYDETNFITGIYSVIHESGHSMYERNRPLDWRLQPVGQACGFAVHESQSLFFEKQIGMNINFIKNLHRDMVTIFGCKDFTLEEFCYQINHVEPSFIRVDADEVTYPLHIILRYEIEKDLIKGSLDIKHLPERWNANMKEIFNIIPPNNSMGCLQDIHWYWGHFGYFPAYTVGAIMAAQLMVKMRSDIGGIDNLIQADDFSAIIHWLNVNVHNHGSRYLPDELINIATNEPLSVEHYKEYLRSRYLSY